MLLLIKLCAGVVFVLIKSTSVSAGRGHNWLWSVLCGIDLEMWTSWSSLPREDGYELIIYNSCRDPASEESTDTSSERAHHWTTAQDQRCLETDFLLVLFWQWARPWTRAVETLCFDLPRSVLTDVHPDLREHAAEREDLINNIGEIRINYDVDNPRTWKT